MAWSKPGTAGILYNTSQNNSWEWTRQHAKVEVLIHSKQKVGWTSLHGLRTGPGAKRESVREGKGEA